MEMSLWAAIYVVYSVALRGLATVFRDLKEAEISHWLTALWEAECGMDKRTWSSDAHRFWTTNDTNLLTNFYYRGLPGQFVNAFGRERNLRQTLQEQRTNWMLSVVDDAARASHASLQTIPANEFDLKRGHRLYVFPMLIAIQFLPHADQETGGALSWQIGQLLAHTQQDRGPYTESARDQINQMIPQILTDQLRVGPISWNGMVVTRDVLDRLFDLGTSLEKMSRFETALGRGLQFLVYYRASLDSAEKKKRFPSICREQTALIDQYFNEIFLGRLPVDPSFLSWLDALQEHANGAMASGNPSRTLVRQTSAAVMARHSGAQEVPDKIWHLSVLDSLRAAHCSLGLPDCQDRRDRVTLFLSENGVTHQDGINIIEKYVSRRTPDFQEDMMEFVKHLPEEISRAETLKPELFSLAPEITVDELWAELSAYRTWKTWEDVTVTASLAAKPVADVVTKTIGPLVRRGLKRSRKKRAWDHSRTKRLRTLIRQVMEEELSHRGP